jgi:hypothetical protein
MTTPPATLLYKRHRFPAEIIRHCVWRYFRFSLSYRDVQEMMAERGVIVSHEGFPIASAKFRTVGSLSAWVGQRSHISPCLTS